MCIRDRSAVNWRVLDGSAASSCALSHEADVRRASDEEDLACLLESKINASSTQMRNNVADVAVLCFHVVDLSFAGGDRVFPKVFLEVEYYDVFLSTFLVEI